MHLNTNVSYDINFDKSYIPLILDPSNDFYTKKQIYHNTRKFKIRFVGAWHGLNHINLFSHDPKYIPKINFTPIFIFNTRNKIVKECRNYVSRYNQYYLASSLNKYIYHSNSFSFFFLSECPYIHNKSYHKAYDVFVDHVDTATGILFPEQLPSKYNNYFLLPYFLYEIISNIGFPTLKELQAYIQDLNDIRLKHSSERSQYCNLICSHNKVYNFKGVREDILNIINKHLAPINHTVQCAGAYKNNTNELTQKYGNDKISYSKNFIFQICPENCYASGYVTEKIFHAISSGSIPIYWGAIEEFYDIFNQNAIIYFNPRKSNEFDSYIHKLINDKQALDQLIQHPPFVAGAAETLFIRFFAHIYQKFESLNIKFNFLRGNKPNVPDSYDWKQDFAQAKLTLENLGKNKVDFQDYLLTASRYKWPFLKTDRIRVGTRSLNLLNLNAKFKVNKYFNSINIKPLYDNTYSNIQALDTDRIKRKLFKITIKNQLQESKIHSIFNSSSNKFAKLTQENNNKLSAFTFNKQFAIDFGAEKENLTKSCTFSSHSQKLLNINIGNNFKSEDVKNIIHTEFNTVDQIQTANLSITNLSSEFINQYLTPPNQLLWLPEIYAIINLNNTHDVQELNHNKLYPKTYNNKAKIVKKSDTSSSFSYIFRLIRRLFLYKKGHHKVDNSKKSAVYQISNLPISRNLIADRLLFTNEQNSTLTNLNYIGSYRLSPLKSLQYTNIQYRTKLL